MQLAERRPAACGPPCRDEAADRSSRSKSRLGLQRSVERLDDALHVQEAALGDRRRRAAARSAGRRPVGTRARSRRARSRAAPASTLRRAASTRLGKQRRAQRGQLDRDRLGQLPGRVVVGREARRVGLGEAEADERVLDAAAQLLLAGERAEHLAARGQRERHVLEPEARDLLDDVDLARHVARAPGRDDHVARLRARSRGGRAARTGRSGGVSMPITASARSGRKRDHRPLGQLARGRRRRPSTSPPVELEDQRGREVGGRLGEVRVDALLPAVRALGAQALALGGAVDAVRLEVRRLEQDGRRAARRSRSPRRP